MELLWYPHETLRAKSIPLSLEQVKSEAFRQLVSRMFLIMYKHKGVGLAAPQVGLNVNLIVGNHAGRPNHDSQAFVLINPEVIIHGDPVVIEEGCLSLPGIYSPVSRPEKIKVKSMDINGVESEFEAKGFISRIIQHEFDHLQGTMFIDHLSEPDEKAIRHQLKTHTTRVARVRRKRNKERKKMEAKAKKQANKRK